MRPISSTPARPLRTVIALTSAAAMLTLAACGGTGSAEANVIRIGTDDGQEEHWQILSDKLAEEGITLEVESFTDGAQINSATQQGQLDINLFQHLQYLAQFNVNNDGDLVPIGATAVYPLALYSLEHDSLESLPEGAEVAIPDNPTNQARALLNLQAAGLLTLREGGNTLSTPADIETSSIEVLPVDSNQTVNAIKGSSDAAVVNNTQAQKGGLGNEEIIYKDDLESGTNDPYINAFVVKEENKDDENLKRVWEAYHTPEVQESVTELNGGNLLFKQEWTAEELQELLAGEEELVRQSQ